MNDEQLQREIEEALSAEPSPQFIARVRRQIAIEPRPSRRIRWFTLAAGVAAAVLIGFLVLQPWPSQNVVPEKSAKTLVPEPAVPIPDVKAPPVEPTPQAPVVSQVASHPPQPKSVEANGIPEVLIDPREVEAFKRFVDAVETQNIDPTRLERVFDAAERTNKEGITPMPLAGLEPIRIEPLSSAAPERGNL